MITHPTVFILGAGASVDVGYPTGAQLTDRIYFKLQRDQSARKAAIAAGFNEDEIDAFANDLHGSQLLTIDSFLAERTVYRELGKFAISYELISCESETDLKQKGRASWYRLLRLALGNGLDDLRRNRVKIITFNYDRSLIHFLYSAFCSVIEKTESTATVQALLSNLAFLPIHGALSPLTWQSSNGRPYEATQNANIIKEASRCVLTADESSNITYAGKTPEELIEEAERVMFLGFGFDQKNMDKLGLARFRGAKDKVFAASTVNLGERRVRMLRDSFRIKQFGTIDEIFLNTDISS